jgi:hypothetical protein
MILAEVVFPVPGGPSNNIALGQQLSSLILVAYVIYS